MQQGHNVIFNMTLGEKKNCLVDEFLTWLCHLY